MSDPRRLMGGIFKKKWFVDVRARVAEQDDVVTSLLRAWLFFGLLASVGLLCLYVGWQALVAGVR